MTMSSQQQDHLKSSFFADVSNINQEDAGKAFEQGSSKIDALKDDVPSKIKALWGDITCMVSMLGDYVRGNYRDTPWSSIAAVTAAILYFASPIDLIPDVIPIIGYLDDAFVVALAVDFVRDDLVLYRQWKEGRA